MLRNGISNLEAEVFQLNKRRGYAALFLTGLLLWSPPGWSQENESTTPNPTETRPEPDARLDDPDAPRPPELEPYYDPNEPRPNLEAEGLEDPLDDINPNTTLTFEPENPYEKQRNFKMEKDNYELVQLALGQARQMQHELDPDQFAEALYRGIGVDIPGLGKAKVTRIDSIWCIRVVLEGQALGILNLDLSGIKVGSKHLRAVIAKQKINSARDVLVANLNSSTGEIDGVEFSERERMFSPKWFRDFWHAIRASPSMGDVLLGGICGLYQYGFTLFLKMAPMLIAKAVAGELTYRMVQEAFTLGNPQAILTGLFGAVIGIWCTQYQNLINLGKTVQERVLASASVGGTFAYMFTALYQYIMGEVSTLGAITSVAAFFTTIHVIVGQVYKDEMNFASRQSLELRELGGMQKVFGFETPIGRKNAYNQVVYNSLNIPFKMVDIAQIKIAGFPIGKLAFYTSIVPLRLFARNWSKKKEIKYAKLAAEDPSYIHLHKKSEEHLAEAERKWAQVIWAAKHPIQATKAGVVGATRIVTDGIKALAGRCSSAFGRHKFTHEELQQNFSQPIGRYKARTQ